jgi:thiamine biosynthesis lipoprotein
MPMPDPLRPSRRELLSLGLGVFVVSMLPLTAAVRRGRVIRRQLPIMGTIADISVVHDDPVKANAAIDAAFATLRQMDRVMSRFRPDSDIGRANADAAREWVTVNVATAHLIREGQAYAVGSGGAFDPCLGRATMLWDPTRHAPPARQRFQRLAGRRLFEKVDMRMTTGLPKVRFTDPDVALDLGGIAKGFAVDEAADVLRQHGIERGLVNVGGDLVALGASEDGDPWKVGVRSASDPSRIERTIRVTDEAVATSGDYERYFCHGGRNYHHLLDPRTAAPRDSDVHSVTVVAASCMDADAGATAAFGMPAEWARRLLAVRGARLA